MSTGLITEFSSTLTAFGVIIEVIRILSDRKSVYVWPIHFFPIYNWLHLGLWRWNYCIWLKFARTWIDFFKSPCKACKISKNCLILYDTLAISILETSNLNEYTTWNEKNGNSCVENQISRQIKYQLENLIEILQTNIMLPTSIDLRSEKDNKECNKMHKYIHTRWSVRFLWRRRNLRIKKKVQVRNNDQFCVRVEMISR